MIFSTLALVSLTSAAFNCSNVSDGSGNYWDLNALFTNNLNISLAVQPHELISVDRFDLLLNLCRPLASGNGCDLQSNACRVITNVKGQLDWAIRGG